MPSQTGFGALSEAFTEITAHIPVLQIFHLDGTINDDDCRGWIDNFLPDFISDSDMLLRKFWVEFLHRRVMT